MDQDWSLGLIGQCCWDSQGLGSWGWQTNRGSLPKPTLFITVEGEWSSAASGTSEYGSWPPAPMGGLKVSGAGLWYSTVMWRLLHVEGDIGPVGPWGWYWDWSMETGDHWTRWVSPWGPHHMGLWPLSVHSPWGWNGAVSDQSLFKPEQNFN